jgi:hypothetical protein
MHCRLRLDAPLHAATKRRGRSAKAWQATSGATSPARGRRVRRAGVCAGSRRRPRSPAASPPALTGRVAAVAQQKLPRAGGGAKERSCSAPAATPQPLERVQAGASAGSRLGRRRGGGGGLYTPASVPILSDSDGHGRARRVTASHGGVAASVQTRTGPARPAASRGAGRRQRPGVAGSRRVAEQRDGIKRRGGESRSWCYCGAIAVPQ